METDSSVDEPKEQALHYWVADLALRSSFSLTLPNESAIPNAGAQMVQRDGIAEQGFPTYDDKEVFEDVVRQADLRHHTPWDPAAVEE